VAGDVMAGAPLETYREDIAEEAKKAKQIFESFMQKHDVPRAAETTESLSFGWLDDASEGESFIGSYGRIYSSHDRSGYGVEFRKLFKTWPGFVRFTQRLPYLSAGLVMILGLVMTAAGLNSAGVFATRR
jgi:hypothetical protein